MQLFNTLFVASMALSSLACKCVQDGANDAATSTCCTSLGGRYSGNDCAADTISESLSNFRQCCENQDSALTSDCDFPGKRDDALGAVQKRAPVVKEIKSAGTIMTLVV